MGGYAVGKVLFAIAHSKALKNKPFFGYCS